MDPAMIAMLVQAAASIGGGMLGAGGNKETKQQKQSRKLADELLASMKSGEGPFASLFQGDENAFQKSIVDPMMSKFDEQIAPMIQQQYVSQGQHRGTALDDELLRAGVGVQDSINQQYLPFQQGGQQNMMSMLQGIMNQGPGAANPLSTGEKFGQSAGGYMASDSFGDLIKQLMPQGQNKITPQSMNRQSPRGFTNDYGVAR